MTEEIPAAGVDFDSRRRELKTSLAAAETRGDVDAADALSKELDKVTKAQERAAAAAARKAAARADDVEDAQKTPPKDRTPAPPKATTKQADASAMDKK